MGGSHSQTKKVCETTMYLFHGWNVKNTHFVGEGDLGHPHKNGRRMSGNILKKGMVYFSIHISLKRLAAILLLSPPPSYLALKLEKGRWLEAPQFLCCLHNSLKCEKPSHAHRFSFSFPLPGETWPEYVCGTPPRSCFTTTFFGLALFICFDFVIKLQSQK